MIAPSVMAVNDGARSSPFGTRATISIYRYSIRELFLLVFLTAVVAAWIGACGRLWWYCVGYDWTHWIAVGCLLWGCHRMRIPDDRTSAGWFALAAVIAAMVSMRACIESFNADGTTLPPIDRYIALASQALILTGLIPTLAVILLIYNSVFHRGYAWKNRWFWAFSLMAVANLAANYIFLKMLAGGTVISIP